MRLNEKLTYKELCEEFNEEPCVGGANRERQITRFRKMATIDRIDKKHFVVVNTEQDARITDKNKIRKELLEFCKTKYISIVGGIDNNIKSNDKIEYICNFHPDVVQTATVYNLLRSTGCTLCKYPMSRMEVALFLSIPGAIHRQKIMGAEFDISIPSQKVLIEYNGILYHNDEKDLETREKKETIAKQCEYRLINIEEIINAEIKVFENTIVIPPYAVSRKEIKNKIIKVLEDNIPLCTFTPDLWDKAAIYMRDWKAKTHNKENKTIKQYDSEGQLIAEYDGFSEIKRLIVSGTAFGYNWAIE